MESDHGLVEVIFFSNGSRTSWLSSWVRRQTHYGFILALQAYGIIFHIQDWQGCSVDSILFFAGSLPPPATFVAPPPPVWVWVLLEWWIPPESQKHWPMVADIADLHCSSQSNNRQIHSPHETLAHCLILQPTSHLNICAILFTIM